MASTYFKALDVYGPVCTGQLFSRKPVLCLSGTKHSIWLHLFLDHHLSIFVNLMGEMMCPGYFNLHFVENQWAWTFCCMLILHLHFLFGDVFVLYSGICFGSWCFSYWFVRIPYISGILIFLFCPICFKHFPAWYHLLVNFVNSVTKRNFKMVVLPASFSPHPLLFSNLAFHPRGKCNGHNLLHCFPISVL